VTGAAALAALSAGLAVAAAWNALAAIERSTAAAGVARLIAPLLRAGREGREPTLPERRRLALLAAAGLLVGGWLVAGPVAGAALAAGGPWAAVTLVRVRRRRYLADLERGAPLLARALADALAGGHSVRGALLAAATGGGVPGAAGSEVRAAASHLELGEATETALERLRSRAGTRAFDTIVAAVMLQSRAGGDLARLLRELGAALEDSLRLEQDARTATAQARFTGLVVTVLPVGAAALAELGSPGYLASLVRSPLTTWLLGCALALQAGAFVVIGRLARVRA